MKKVEVKDVLCDSMTEKAKSLERAILRAQKAVDLIYNESDDGDFCFDEVIIVLNVFNESEIESLDYYLDKYYDVDYTYRVDFCWSGVKSKRNRCCEIFAKILRDNGYDAAVIHKSTNI